MRLTVEYLLWIILGLGNEDAERVSPQQTEVYLHNLILVLRYSLDPKIAQAIRARYFTGKTYKEIGIIMNLSSERVRQLVVKGVRMLKHPDRRGAIIGTCTISDRSPKYKISDVERIIEEMFREDGDSTISVDAKAAQLTRWKDKCKRYRTLGTTARIMTYTDIIDLIEEVQRRRTLEVQYLNKISKLEAMLRRAGIIVAI